MAKKAQNAKKRFDYLVVTEVQLTLFREGAQGGCLAKASVVLNDQLTITSMRVMDGVNGLYVAYPNDPFYSGDTYSSIVYPITRELREHIENCVLEKYRYETEKANVKFDVKLTHRDLFGGVLELEIIASNETEAELKANEKAIEIIPSTKDNGEWKILQVENTNNLR